MTRYYKSFKPGRVGPYSGVKWPKRIGAWVKVEGELIPCENGIHVARGERELLEHWLDAEMYEVEVRGERMDAQDKACVRECRLIRQVLDKRSLRLFAADCAEHALTVAGVTDERSWDAVRVARLHAKGKASRQELDAARAAAHAAWATAWATAWTASADAAWAAARDAARDAAWDAAWSASADAAWDAAWAAVRAAAWDAAWAASADAAWAAARDAARDAAWDAAWSAVRAAAWDRQALLLRWYIDGEQGDKPSLDGGAA